MNWYAACCFYTTSIKGKAVKRGELSEYRYFLLRASNDSGARAKALRMGKSKRHSYKNAAGQEVRWIFRKLVHARNHTTVSFEFRQLDIYVIISFLLAATGSRFLLFEISTASGYPLYFDTLPNCPSVTPFF